MLNQVLYLVHNQLSLDINEDDSVRNETSPSRNYSRIFVSAVNNSFSAALVLLDSHCEALMCRGQDSFEDQESLFMGGCTLLSC